MSSYVIVDTETKDLVKTEDGKWLFKSRQQAQAKLFKLTGQKKADYPQRYRVFEY